jgi:hypothetical protein
MVDVSRWLAEQGLDHYAEGVRREADRKLEQVGLDPDQVPSS